MDWVILWLVIVAALGGLLVRWYFYARPSPRFDRSGNPDHLKGSVGRFKTVVEWDHTHTMKTCPACGGWGELQWDGHVYHVIPREQWEKALWSRGNLFTCKACKGLGKVSRNWRPPNRFRWPEGAPVAA